MENTTDKLISTSAAAEILGVRRETILKWLKNGKLQGVQLTDRIIRVRENDIQKIITAKGRHCILPDAVKYKKITVTPEHLKAILEKSGVKVSLTTLMEIFFSVEDLYN